MTSLFTPQPQQLPTTNAQINSWLFNQQPRDPPYNQVNTYTTPFATTYLDNGAGAIGSGGTHFENLWSDFTGNSWLQGSGPGTQSSPQGFIFLVTDGADNGQICGAGCNGSTPQLAPQSPPSPLANDFCAAAKQAGYTVAVLLIPYVPIPNPDPSFANNEDGNVNTIAEPSASGGPSQIETRMQACASSGYYAKASSSQDITNAIQSLFVKATQQARLTQ
jgi:hypothetical protein